MDTAYDNPNAIASPTKVVPTWKTTIIWKPSQLTIQGMQSETNLNPDQENDWLVGHPTTKGKVESLHTHIFGRKLKPEKTLLK